jgi:hypothetical protein
VALRISSAMAASRSSPDVCLASVIAWAPPSSA